MCLALYKYSVNSNNPSASHPCSGGRSVSSEVKTKDSIRAVESDNASSFFSQVSEVCSETVSMSPHRQHAGRQSTRSIFTRSLYLQTPLGLPTVGKRQTRSKFSS